MMFVLVISTGLSFWYKPRRSRLQNLLDCFVSIVQVTVLSVGATSVHVDALSDELSVVCVLLITSVFIVIVSACIYRAILIVSNTYSHAIYLSHHSGVGGAASRVFHRILTATVDGSIFYDIDNMGDVGRMFDAVLVARNVLMAFGSETLCRPWCIGAMVAAHRRGIPMSTIIFTNVTPEETVCIAPPGYKYTKPHTQKSFQSSRAVTFEVDTYVLRGYGLDQEQVGPAIQTLTREDPTCINFRSQSNLIANLGEIFEGMAGTLKLKIPANQATKSFFISEEILGQHRDGCGSIREGNLPHQPNLILCDHCDGEAVAVSRFFMTVFGKKGSWLEDQDMPSKDYATIVRAAQPSNCLFMFSRQTSDCVAQLARLALLVKCHPEMHMVPVVSGVTFDFPDEDFLRMLETGGVLNLGPDPQQLLTALAGEVVSLKQIVAGLTHVMSFLVSFINFPQLTEKQSGKALHTILTLATGVGRKTSLSKLPVQGQNAPDPVTPDPVPAPSWMNV